jgi:pyruvate/2-oxoacid:ferredoxin oxidoreductase alpha subunit/pyruvate/2-oxoacid:ferredoxin oxidoreductase beta subunit
MNQEFDVMPGNKAVAHGARLARVEVVPAFPITPQTTIIEYISEFIANGELDAEYIHGEGEHSCMAMAVGASLVGARTFTATCSQGLAYMHEVVAQATNYRTPIVMAVANRTLGWYWSLGPDYSDIMPEMNLGWVVNFVETNQECLDQILMNYKIGEDYRVLLPTMMSLDGFYLSYSQERVYLPDQNLVDEWLPRYEAPYPVDPTISKAWPSANLPQALHTKYRRLHEEVMEDTKKVVGEVDKSFGAAFGRSYGGMVEKYRCDDAETLMVTMGSMTTAARRAVDKLRSGGEKIGLLKLRYMRPFPRDEVLELAESVKAIGVVDRAVLHGTGGGMAFQDMKSVLYDSDVRVPVKNFVTGLGGEDIPISDLELMGRGVIKVSESGRLGKPVEFIEHEPPEASAGIEYGLGEACVYPGSDGCAGCGASIIVRALLNTLGEDTVVINLPSCSTVNYGGVVKVPWVLGNFAAGAAYQTGVYRALRKRGKADRVYVASFAGDGGTVDIGLQSISGAAERGESIIWVCYDNEAYMNTGIQRSSSTPMFSATSTTPVGSSWKGKPQRRKNMLMIMAAHRAPYIATASLGYIPDFKRKIQRAAEVTRSGEGLAYLHIHQPCATGWYFDASKTVEVARLAVQSGAFPLFEIDHGVLKINVKPKELVPVKEYLEQQRRFGHVTEEQVMNIEKNIQDDWEVLLKLEKEAKLPWY